jgi:hypothetical protein
MNDVAPNPENVGSGAWFRNQVSKPPGILPKNAQTWVIAGLSAVMIAAIAISGNGSKNKPPAVHPARLPSSTPTPPALRSIATASKKRPSSWRPSKPS